MATLKKTDAAEDSSVSTVTRLNAEEERNSRKRKEIVIFYKISRTAPGRTHPNIRSHSEKHKFKKLYSIDVSAYLLTSPVNCWD